MSLPIAYRMNVAAAEQIAEHLEQCATLFVPTLVGRVNIVAYANKIWSNATRMVAWSDDGLVGLVGVYCNDQVNRTAYVTTVSVLPDWSGKGIATRLVRRAVDHARCQGLQRISLKVAREHGFAIHLYENCGFAMGETDGAVVAMHCNLRTEECHEPHT
jgi:ribosomal-protein-alanine N-acetyltransferase